MPTPIIFMRRPRVVSQTGWLGRGSALNLLMLKEGLGGTIKEGYIQRLYKDH